MKLSHAALLFAAAAAVAQPVPAAEFSISPVRIYMGPRDRAVAITITNESDQEVVMQADLYSWKQKPGGEDDLALTEDLILSPPIIKLAGRSRQVVRLARLTPPPAGREQTYRMIVREVPEARPSDKQVQLQVALAFSLPVFITPPGAKRAVDCDAERIAADALRVACRNSGSAYALLRTVEVLSDTGEKLAVRDTAGYVLPDIRRAFEVRSATGKIPGGKVKLRVTFDDSTQQVFDRTVAE